MVLKLSSVSWLVVQHLLTEADEKLGADWYECKNGGARLVLVSFDSVRLSREARRSAPLWRRGRLMSLSSLCMFGAMASMEPVWLEKNGISMSSCWPFSNNDREINSGKKLFPRYRGSEAINESKDGSLW